MPHTPSPPSYKRTDERGEFIEVLAEGTWEAVIFGKMRAGAILGRHYHKRTRIYFYLTAGEADVTVVDVATNDRTHFEIREEHGLFLEPGQAHAIRFSKSSEFIMAKSHRYDPANLDTFPFPIELDQPAPCSSP